MGHHFSILCAYFLAVFFVSIMVELESRERRPGLLVISL
jgi:hypothetical protein